MSIELLAANAAGKSNLKGLAADWSDRRADLLRRGAADDRMTSLRVSLGLSLEALNPPSPAHRLIRLMALLPDGMAEADSRTILSDGEPTREERGAATRLEGARLAGRPDGRWRLLAPVRELLLAEFPPEAQDRDAADKTVPEARRVRSKRRNGPMGRGQRRADRGSGQSRRSDRRVAAGVRVA